MEKQTKMQMITQYVESLLIKQEQKEVLIDLFKMYDDAQKLALELTTGLRKEVTIEA